MVHIHVDPIWEVVSLACSRISVQFHQPSPRHPVAPWLIMMGRIGGRLLKDHSRWVPKEWIRMDMLTGNSEVRLEQGFARKSFVDELVTLNMSERQQIPRVSPNTE